MLDQVLLEGATIGTALGFVSVHLEQCTVLALSTLLFGVIVWIRVGFFSVDISFDEVGHGLLLGVLANCAAVFVIHHRGLTEEGIH